VSSDELHVEIDIDVAKKAGCSEVIAEVWAFLDNECDQRQRDILRQHLDECSPCLEQYGIEEHLKVLLAASAAATTRRPSSRTGCVPASRRRCWSGPRPRPLRRSSSPEQRESPGDHVTGALSRTGSGVGPLPWLAPPFLRSRRLRARLT